MAVSVSASAGDEVGLASLEAAPELHLSDSEGVQLDRLLLLGGGGAALHYAGFRYFDRAWYQGQKSDSIRWINDWSGETYLNMDKGGHFFGGVVLSQSLTEAYGWSGFGPRAAAALGTVTSWAALLEIEMRDAYYDQWGFSIPDFAFNTAGAAVPLMYALVPATRSVRFKFSYWPSRLYRERGERSREPVRPHTEYIIDDYEGMTFWMSFAVEEALRGKAEELWPDYLGVALGFSATGMHGSNVKSRGRHREYKELPNARPEVFVALDYDLRQLPGEGPLWRSVKRQLNWFHLPAPTVRIYPELRLYFLYM